MKKQRFGDILVICMKAQKELWLWHLSYYCFWLTYLETCVSLAEDKYFSYFSMKTHVVDTQ